MKTLLLAGGGTAGHVTPHLAIMPYLMKYFDKICYISSGKAIEKELIEPTGAQIFTVKTPAFIRSLSPQNLLIPFKLFKAVKECEKIIKQTKPLVIFSKGGYGALPVCLAGFRLKIPVVCHESDLTLGLANKLCVKKAKAMLTTFKETASAYKNGVFVGPPIRKEFFNKDKTQCKKALGITNSKPTLLVTGGSQGSLAINSALGQNLNALIKDFNIIHLHGKNNKPLNSAINGYYPFAFADMPTVISACDICISRGGSNTLFELLATHTPSLIIPLERGSRGDQIKNAQYFFKKGALLYASEEDLTENFLTLTNKLYNERAQLKAGMKTLNLQQSAKEIVEILIKYSL